MCVSRFLPALQALLANLADEHLPFIVTDERQRFCPADYVYVDKKGQKRPGRSRCAALYQKWYGKNGRQLS